ncbi:MAG: hypothetical protein OXI24_19220 [Candidatus Poribacteria bacterium]|nr:hypothetical protein [Candidatus Poribacteria bacterium]
MSEFKPYYRTIRYTEEDRSEFRKAMELDLKKLKTFPQNTKHPFVTRLGFKMETAKEIAKLIEFTLKMQIY